MRFGETQSVEGMHICPKNTKPLKQDVQTIDSSNLQVLQFELSEHKMQYP